MIKQDDRKETIHSTDRYKQQFYSGRFLWQSRNCIINMKILTFFQLIFIGFSTFYFLRHYTSKDVPKFVKAICFISWFLSFAILAFVPLDIYSTLNNNMDSDQPTQNSDKFLILVWRVLYWINFVFSWILLPLVKSYIDAGGFTWKEKLKQAILSKLKFYGIIAGLDILFIIYLEATGNGGGEGIMRFFITFTNCFGIIMIIICLSYGLVSIPKNCFQKARRGVYLRTHQFEAAVIDEQREALNLQIIDLIKNMEALLRRNDVDPSLKELLTQIISKAPENLQIQGKDMVGNSELPNPEVYENFNRNKAAKLNKKMTKRLSELKRLDHQWHVTVKHALMLEDLIESRNPCEWRAKISNSPSENSPTLERNLTTLMWIWHVYIARLVYFLAGFVFIAFSIIIFFAEVFNFDDFDIYNVESFIKSGGGALAKSQLLCLIPLIYIAMCVYSGVFNMKLAGCRNLYQHQQTDAPSLIFASLSLSRVSSPLVFNFLQMLNIEGTAFHAVMGNVKFANSFIRYFPLLLSLLVLCNIFEVYDRILNKFGLGKFQFNAVYSNERIQEGKTLLTKARGDRNRQMNKLNLQNNQPSNGDRQEPVSEGEVSMTSTKTSNSKPGSTCKESPQQGYLMNNDKNLKILSIGSMGDIEE